MNNLSRILALSIVSAETGKDVKELQEIIEEQEEKTASNVRLISEKEVCEAVAHAFAEHTDLKTSLDLGRKVTLEVVHTLFDKEEGED